MVVYEWTELALPLGQLRERNALAILNQSNIGSLACQEIKFDGWTGTLDQIRKEDNGLIASEKDWSITESQ
jgi:hypothetical protein